MKTEDSPEIDPARPGPFSFGKDPVWLRDVNRMRELFQRVWSNSLDGMRLADSAGIIVDVNHAFCELVGIEREKLIGHPFHTPYFYDDPDTKLREFRERFVQRIIPRRFELSVVLRNGEPRDYQLSSSFFEVEGEHFLLTIYRDITERRKNEKEKERLNAALSQRASQLADRTLDLIEAEQQERQRLARRMHDELQQYLVAARVRLERARQVPGGTPTDEDLNAIHSILTDSIDATRSLSIELAPPGLHEDGLVNALEWLVKTLKTRNGMTVRLSVVDDVEPESPNLRGFLFDAVRELLFNVFKHACVDEAEVRLSRDGSSICIEVIDAGIGISKGKLEEGNGREPTRLGLIGMIGRVAHLGGDLTVDSSPGEGTAVKLTIPLGAIKDNVAIPLVRKGSDDGASGREGEGPFRVLLVDDHKLLRDGLRELLRADDTLEVIGEAENGLTGIESAMRLRPDVVLMDITMPEMNGIDATRLLCERLPEIVVIGLSMHEKEDMAAAMLDAGAAAYVSKAAAGDTLITTLRECLQARTEQAQLDNR